MVDDPFPKGIEAMLASAGPLPPPTQNDQFAYEIKWDGVRALTYLDDGRIHIESRNRNDITARYPELAGLATEHAGHRLVLDGEVVAFDHAGRPSFGRLQSRMHVTNEREVAARTVDTPVTYFVFDLLHLDSHNTMPLPWTERRHLLEALALSGPSWQTPAAHIGDGELLLGATKERGLEGVVAKRLTSIYVPGRRSRDWIKVKNVCRQEVVIGGWLAGSGRRTGRIGALLVGYYDETGLRFTGKVGTASRARNSIGWRQCSRRSPAIGHRSSTKCHTASRTSSSRHSSPKSSSRNGPITGHFAILRTKGCATTSWPPKFTGSDNRVTSRNSRRNGSTGPLCAPDWMPDTRTSWSQSGMSYWRNSSGQAACPRSWPAGCCAPAR